MKFPDRIITCQIVLILALLNIKPATVMGADETQPATTETQAVKDQPLADYRLKLLDLAFEAASKIPVYPHVKDRSKAQEAVVDVCLKLDQPERALEYINRVKNWRRGAGLADFACYCIENKIDVDVQSCLDRAEAICRLADQDWRRDRIRVKIARAYVLLGQTGKAARFEKNLSESEQGKVNAARAALADEKSFQSNYDAMVKMAATSEFDLQRNALTAMTELYDRFYKDVARRDRVEQSVIDLSSKLPLFVRVDLSLRMSRAAVDHGDQPRALKLVEQARSLTVDDQSPLEYRIALQSSLAEARFKAGDKEKAVKHADEILTLYRDKGQAIVNIYRASALIGLAQAYQTMGETEKAIATYKLAATEAVANPNARPQAMDLVSICISMARYGVQPDEPLWPQLRKIHLELSEPW